MAKLQAVEYGEILEKHNTYYRTGTTKKTDFRLEQLKRLKTAIKSAEAELLEALWQDLHKSKNEAFTTEIGALYSSINYAVKKLKKWVKPVKAGTPLMLFGTKSRIYHEPFGTVLIIGPFNYPVNLIFEPLIGAIAAGNCAVIKPSELSPNVSGLISDIVSKAFDEDYIRVVEGGKDVTSQLISLPFDYIFYTGGGNTGKIIMKAASENLVPVTLELGGKSPCIVDETADLDTAARKITWGKFTNAGQTCVAPDYLVVHKNVKDILIENIRKYTEKFYGSNPEESADFGRIINRLHTERLMNLITPGKIISGGLVNIENKYVSPTLLESSWDDEVMKEEIFGPVLPVLKFENIDELIVNIIEKPKSLALYVFSKNKYFYKKVLDALHFGGGCINDVLVHAGNPDLPFGGIGASGIGSYHGKRSYETFSHEKGILQRVINIESSVMYPPYDDKKLSMIKRILK